MHMCTFVLRRRLVSLMGGSIEVSSPTGCGSSFVFDVAVDMLPSVSGPTAATSMMTTTTASSLSAGPPAPLRIPAGHSSTDPVDSNSSPIITLEGANAVPAAASSSSCHPATFSSASDLNRRPSQVSGMRFDDRAAEVARATRLVLDGAPAATGTASSPPPWPSTANEPLQSPLRILLVDDSVVNAMIVSALLKKAGFPDVVMCCNGREAVDVIERSAFSICLMDCEMPIMDGFAATAEIRRRGNKIPIVAMTGA